MALLLVTFGAFYWAMRRFFRTEVPKPARMARVERVGFVSVAAHFATICWGPLPAGQASFVLACLAYTLSFSLFCWTLLTNIKRPLSIAYSNDVPEHVVCVGPYRWIRHPFYTSYVVAWCAGVIATLAWWLALTVVAMTWLYYDAALYEERKFAASAMSEQYRAYSRHAGRFLPRLIRARRGRA